MVFLLITYVSNTAFSALTLLAGRLDGHVAFYEVETQQCVNVQMHSWFDGWFSSEPHCPFDTFLPFVSNKDLWEFRG